MKINITDSLDIKQELLVLGLWEDNKDLFKKYNSELSEDLSDALSRKSFEKEFGKTYSTKIAKATYKKVLIISLGKKEEMTVDRIRRVSSRIINYMKSSKFISFTTSIALDIEKFGAKDIGRAMAEGLILSEYVFDKYKTNKTKTSDQEISASLQINSKMKLDFESGLKTGKIIAESTNFAKNMINEPPVVVTPQYLENVAKDLAKKNSKIKVKILEKKDMEKESLNAILAVSSGSDKPPKLIFIEYNGAGQKSEPIAIVGKGITFDSGGYDIKPAGQFMDMKCDMSGGAAVLGTIKAVSELGLKINIIGCIPACENMINGSAMKPGDIITAYNGKTIEVANTDAEGRLVLADAISYTEKNYSPSIIIDLATLTGACVVALGYYVSGIVSNNNLLEQDLVKAGFESYDRVWPLPFFEEYQDNMDGDITDLRSISSKGKGREAGAITGGVFISKFVDKAAWAHIDIAGPAFLAEAKEYNQKYASGCGVRLLTYYFMEKS